MAQLPPPLPPMLGPVRAPARYNLQNFHDIHNANIQHIVLESQGRWLTVEEILVILLSAEANILPLSTPPVADAQANGLFVYNKRAYRDHGLYQQVGDNGLIERFNIAHGVTMGESRGLVDHLYRKRIYRRFERFARLAVVHYRTVNEEEP